MLVFFIVVQQGLTSKPLLSEIPTSLRHQLGDTTAVFPFCIHP